MNAFAGKYIWIIGASSGIGAALARTLAAQGAVLAVSARNREPLEALARDMGPAHTALPIDVTDAPALVAAAAKLGSTWPRIDSIIMMAGVYTPKPMAAMDLADAKHIIDVNLTGCLNVIHMALPVFHAQGGGQLALCASVAGYRGLPNGQPYCATKAAVISLAESLRAEEAANNIDVRVICPGFVHTPMTAKNAFNMPMAISADEAATAIAQGLRGRSFEIDFPKKFTILMKILRVLPDALYFRIASKMVR